MKKTPIRNANIDALRCLCAFLVVCIHCTYQWREVFLPLTDIAVPMFFLISGYFLCGTERIGRNIKRILKITCLSIALYYTKTVLWHLLSGEFYCPSLNNLAEFFLFNNVVFAIHLWYLPAYLYCLIICFCIEKYTIWEYFFLSIPILLFLGVLIKGWVDIYCPANIFIYRNFLFMGLPWVLTGRLLKKTPPPSICASFRIIEYYYVRLQCSC